MAAQWFDEVAFVGDSVSVMLEQYNSSAAALGKATFLCSVSLSQQNALSYDTGSQRLPEYPKGSASTPSWRMPLRPPAPRGFTSCWA